MERLIGPALIDKVPRDHSQPDGEFRRRRVVAAVTLVVGAVLLGLVARRPSRATRRSTRSRSRSRSSGSLGGFLSGPLHLGAIEFRGSLRRPVVTPLAVGVVAAAVFVLGGLVVRVIGPLRDRRRRRARSTPSRAISRWSPCSTLVNGAAEEVFFRGALYAAIGRHRPVLVSTVIYVLVTVATGNPMLVFAAVLMGTLFGLQRRASGGILAPMITHLVWSTVLIFVLPPLLAR